MTEAQLPIDFAAARAARDRGMQQAIDHANRVDPSWADTVYTYLRVYARTHPSFTTEDVRRAAGDEVPTPPDKRAWGGVVNRAVRAGVVARSGFVQAKDPKVHCNVVTLWRSLVYPGASAS